MLSANQFTVGTLADAMPLSLMLPRINYEAAFLIGQDENGPIAIFIGGNHSFQFFNCKNSNNWSGLLIPNVRIEVDEETLFDPDSISAQWGTVIRTDKRLILLGKGEHSFGRKYGVTLETDLPLAHNLRAGFSKWRIVIGEGKDKNVLKEVDTGQKIILST